MRRDCEIAIVGGGLTGPTTELLLRRAGFNNVTTYEGASQSRPQSGGMIGIGSSLAQIFDRAGIPVSEVSVTKATDIDIYDVEERRVTGRRDRVVYDGTNTTWSVFNDAVRRRVSVQHGKQVTGLSTDGSKAVLNFSDKTSTSVDLVVFADGRSSTGRSLLAPERKYNYLGHVLWSGYTDPPSASHDTFTRYWDDDNGAVFVVSDPITQGKYKGKCSWVLYQNIDGGDFKSMTGKTPTQQLLYYPNKITPQMRSVMRQHAETYFPQFIADIVSTTEEIIMAPANDIELPDNASYCIGNESHAILIGDALQFVHPWTARGLNNGLEQALSLVDHLSQFEDPHEALTEWEAVIIPRLEYWQKLGVRRAREYGLHTSPGQDTSRKAA